MQIILLVIRGLGLLISYFVLRRYFNTPQKRKNLLIFYLIITPLAIAGALFGRYMYDKDETEAFKAAVSQLKSDPKVLKQIGDYKYYSFFPALLPKETENPAKFKVSLIGSDATIYLECVMQKDKSDKWFLKEVKEDSLVKR